MSILLIIFLQQPLNVAQVSKPFFATLHKWLFSGELYDPFSEFFVAVDPELAHMQYIQPPSVNGALPGDEGFGGPGAGYQEDLSLDNEGGLRLWESKYTFRQEMLPAFVGETFGRKVCTRRCEYGRRDRDRVCSL